MYICMYIYIRTYIFICTSIHTNLRSTHTHLYTCMYIRPTRIHILPRMQKSPMGWLRLVGSLKLQVSFAKEPYKRDDILQKRLIILRSLRVVATPYQRDLYSQKHTLQHTHCNTHTLQHTYTATHPLQHTPTATHTLQHTHCLTYIHMHVQRERETILIP